MATITYSNELYHHGIKGMKWGVRRYQHKDGSLTNAGKKRYNDSDSNSSNKTNSTKQSFSSKHRSKLETVFMGRGMTREEAQKAADKRIKMEKVLAVTAGVTIAAATAYVINRNIKERAEQVIKAGESMKRIEGKVQKGLFTGLDKTLHNDFYVTNNEYDNKNYMDAFGYIKKHNYGKAYQVDIQATKDIKIASQKHARDTLKDLIKNNEEFRETLQFRDLNGDLKSRQSVPGTYIRKLRKGQHVPDRIMRKIYDNYNTNLVLRDDVRNENHKIFYDALKKQGYGGIQDINDLKFSYLRGKNPLIIFDKSSTKVKSITDVTEKMSKKKLKQAYDRMDKLRISQSIAKAMPSIAGISTSVLARSMLLDEADYRYHKKKQEENKSKR